MSTHLSNPTRSGTIAPPRRSAPFDQEPGFYSDARLWLYGNARLLGGNLAHIEQSLGPPIQPPATLDEIERETERLILSGKVLVTGIHNAAHQRAAVVPLRWGSPRILIVSGGFEHHLGKDLKQEPFRTARLWRYQFDERTDLVISRRAPDRLPTFAHHNPTVDRLIVGITTRQIDALLFRGPTQ